VTGSDSKQSRPLPAVQALVGVQMPAAEGQIGAEKELMVIGWS